MSKHLTSQTRRLARSLWIIPSLGLVATVAGLVIVAVAL
ncbi:hypothetical protein EniyanLRS_126 [Mycobacterium phage EniyanLRS]|uniref:Uncharacterized protein n=1 Tax=Mycobacterium phage EniyanLRS TaxID=1933770 RepID=A0A2I2MPJ8_9CAUD|nr:hypothetical protein EniyanLRS_126 [Mycobacterium phage EniyanLRS]